MIKVGWRNQILRRMRYFIKILDRESSFEIEGEGKFRFSRKLNLRRICIFVWRISYKFIKKSKEK